MAKVKTAKRTIKVRVAKRIIKICAAKVLELSFGSDADVERRVAKTIRLLQSRPW
jgi:hypothetical protein